jgi:hypothetical protein
MSNPYYHLQSNQTTAFRFALHAATANTRSSEHFAQFRTAMKTAIVVTSINPPNTALEQIVHGAERAGANSNAHTPNVGND